MAEVADEWSAKGVKTYSANLKIVELQSEAGLQELFIAH